MRGVLLLTVLGLAIGVAGPGAAQPVATTPQAVTGTVKDNVGRLLAGLTVTLHGTESHLTRRTTTTASGSFSFAALPPGTYIISTEKKGFEIATASMTVGSQPVAPIVLALQPAAGPPEVETVTVVAKRLDIARNSLSPEAGSSAYRLSEEDIAQLPQGENTPLNQVVLQAPGAVQDSFGQLHVRGEHGNVQYRLNGIQLPEGISGFGQSISPRLASNVSLMTGALAAQYGFRTSGVVDLETKSGTAGNRGSLEMYGGQRSTFQPSVELSGARGHFAYYLSGTYIGTDRGIEPPTPGPTAIHDHSDQGLGFAYLSYVVGPSMRLSLISGVDVNSFQIPAAPGKQPQYELSGAADFPSQQVAESQFERTFYNVLAVQGRMGERVDYQVAAFSRYSSIDFSPDERGDLIFTGIASKVFRSSFANGLQGDAGYRVSDTHTLRAGFYFSGERAEIDNHAKVFPANDLGQQTSPLPIPIVSNTAIDAWLYGVYLQDEWKPLPPLTINVGLRYDLVDAFVHADQFSPRVGAVWELPTHTTLHAGYARYFTPPPSELVSAVDARKFAGTTGALPSTGNFGIKPEQAHYFDLGVAQTFESGITLGVDSYFKYADHILDEGQFGSALVFSPFNYKRGRIYGTELTGSYRHGDLSTYASFAYSVAQGTQVETGQFNFSPDELAYVDSHFIHLDHDQTFTSSGGAAYTWHGVGIRFDYLFGSGLRNGFMNTDHLPSYLQANAGLSKRFTIPYLGWMEARVDVVNVLDRVYAIRDGTGIGVQAAQYGPRRTFFAGVRMPLWSHQPAPSGT